MVEVRGLNTRYFRSVIKWRRSRNEISGLRENGLWLEDQAVVKGKVRDFYMDRFSGGVRPPIRIDNVVFNKISDEDNGMLIERITEEEIKNAVWSCESSKGPGLDGFNFRFIKCCWGNNFEESGRWPRETNASFISLIPKVDNSQLLNDSDRFRWWVAGTK